MRNKKNVINTIAPTLDYPMGRIQDDLGNGTGTPIVEANNGDIQETVTYFMVKAKIEPNELPDNVSNGYQIASAINEVAGKHDYIYKPTITSTSLTITSRIDNMQVGEFLVLDAEGVNTATINKVNTIDLVSPNVGILKKGDLILIEKVNNLTFKARPMYGSESLKNALIADLKGTSESIPGATNGNIIVDHSLVDISKTRIIYTARYVGVTTTYLITDFKSIILDRLNNQFRVVFSGVPEDQNNPNLRIAIDWWIVNI